MNLVLGVCGSISAYKSVEIMRMFQKQGHTIQVVLSESAARFITPLTFETFLPGRVYSRLFDSEHDPLLHINAGKDSGLLLVAPATANMIAKFAHGIADDLLSCIFLAFDGPVVIAPAMNTNMYANAAVQDNIKILKSRGVRFVDPDKGSLACSNEGTGRLAPPQTIYEFCLQLNV